MTSLSYSAWNATCDTLHAHTQVLGKIAVTLAPPEPQLQHAALRLTARGWESLELAARGDPAARSYPAELGPQPPHVRVQSRAGGASTPG